MTRHLRGKHGTPKEKPAALVHASDDEDYEAPQNETRADSPPSVPEPAAEILPTTDAEAASPLSAADIAEEPPGQAEEDEDTKNDLDPGDLARQPSVAGDVSMFDVEDEILQEAMSARMNNHFDSTNSSSHGKPYICIVYR